MSIEDLTKTQLVLLVLFVSFVTSIASGIITVSLLGDTPLPVTVTQTVNRVVEHTVERVVPGQTLVREVPTIISDEDLQTKTIAGSFPAIVRILAEGDPNDPAATLGFIVSSDGTVVTGASKIADRTIGYAAEVGGKEIYPVEILAVNSESDFAVLKIGKREGETKPLPKFPTVALDEKILSLGQSVVGQAGDALGIIALGVITGLKSANASTTSTMATVHFSENRPQAGSPLLTYRGGMVGMWTNDNRIVYTADLRAAVASALGKKAE